MATVKFFIRNTNAKKPVSINYYVSFDKRRRLKGTTTSKITPKYWDSENQKVRDIIEVYDIKDDINSKLLKFKAFVLKKTGNYETNNLDEISALLKEDIAIYLGKKATPIKLTFYTYAEMFIRQSKNRIIEKTGKPLSKRTIRDYERTIERIKDFEKKEKYPISFETITLEFYYAFKEYLEKENFSINTIGKFIKILKVFMNSATEQGVNTNLGFRNKRFIKSTAPSDQIYLNEKELKAIIKLDLTKNPRLDNARDLFIIGAYTGLRVSDIKKLTTDNIKTFQNKRVFKLIVSKTNTPLTIPIHPEIEKILRKHDGNLPSRMKDQDINDEIKKIGKKAKIKEVVIITTSKGGRLTKEMKKKYELIGNHTARRSFCTNAYISGIPPLDIIAISGHSSIKTLLVYIKITTDQRAVKIAESKFFNPKLKIAK